MKLFSAALFFVVCRAGHESDNSIQLHAEYDIKTNNRLDKGIEGILRILRDEPVDQKQVKESTLLLVNALSGKIDDNSIVREEINDSFERADHDDGENNTSIDDLALLHITRKLGVILTTTEESESTDNTRGDADDIGNKPSINDVTPQTLLSPDIISDQMMDPSELDRHGGAGAMICRLGKSVGKAMIRKLARDSASLLFDALCSGDDDNNTADNVNTTDRADQSKDVNKAEK